MCNPPFFESLSTVRRSDIATHGELIVKGGEVNFITQMIDESFLFRNSCTWWTTLLGKKASIKELIDYLHRKSVCQIKIARLSQGTTSRWVLCWSWGDGEEVGGRATQKRAKKRPLAVSFL
jgi:23S rRNA A1618 N6-methylase RlmF